ncbi:MAG: hypothetical protein E6447_21615, partial [Bradyrhizobium sp.]|nr:hypothetical protein [Bradyrhizobium sp.]
RLIPTPLISEVVGGTGSFGDVIGYQRKSAPMRARPRLPSPWRHIYNPLTIAVAFSGFVSI